MVTYNSAKDYLDTCKSLQDKISAIDSIITTLLLTAANSASNGDILQYSLNDGQVVINTMYRGPEAVTKAVESFERLKNYYRNQLMGRMVRLVDSKNFPGNGFNR